MRLLLDSNVVFRIMLDDNTIGRSAAAAIADAANECLISPVNHWEMALKISVGGYEITDDFETMWKQVTARFGVLAIEPRHTARLIDLPFHHRDPFDRMLIAQAMAENIPLISSDKQFDAYGVARIW